MKRYIRPNLRIFILSGSFNLTFICVPVVFVLIPGVVLATVRNMNDVKDVGIQEHFGKTLPLDIPVIDHENKKSIFKNHMLPGKPALLVPVYYSCKYLCTFTLKGLTEGLNSLEDFIPGKDFTIIGVSMKPEDTSEIATIIRSNQLKAYKTHDLTEEETKYWSFLRGSEKNLTSLLNTAGFYYKRDGDEYAHTAVLIFLTPDGHVARYLYGIQYPDRDFRLALLEAGKGHIGNFVDRLILYCFHYDPSGRHYGLIAWNVMRIASYLIVGVLLIFLVYMFYREKKLRTLN